MGRRQTQLIKQLYKSLKNPFITIPKDKLRLHKDVNTSIIYVHFKNNVLIEGNNSIFARYSKEGMKRFLVFIFLITTTTFYAQINEIGVIMGGSNYVGDIGKTDYLAPNDVAYGIIYKWNKSRRHAFRFSYLYSPFSGNDAQADVPARVERNLRFSNATREFSAGLEFNFFDFDMHQLTRQFTPYVATGISFLQYRNLYHVPFQPVAEDGRKWTAGIPMIVGVKTNVGRNWVLALEAQAKYTFSDNLDGSNPDSSGRQTLKFGNINSKDWVFFTGFTLTYTFGENACFCPY